MRVSFFAAGAVFAQVVFGQDTLPPPTKFGIALFPGFQVIDAFGPLDVLNVLAWRTQLNLSTLAATLDPIPTSMKAPPHNRSSSTFEEYILPTHTFATAPPIEVLIVPGGLGNRLPAAIPTVDYIRSVYPSLRYLITVCTGAGLAARAGVLDNKKATTNKWAFFETSKLGPKTHWVAKARWVQDGNIWTSSGVSAGIDVMLAWVSSIWGYATAKELSDGLEYEWHEDKDWDPFSEKWKAVDVISGVTQTPTATPSAPSLSTASTTSVCLTKIETVTATATVTVTNVKTTTTSTKSGKSSKTTKGPKTTRTGY